MNLLRETLIDIKESGHEVSDIIYIGAEYTGYCCNWQEYEILANIEYDNDYAAQEIASDLIIVFSDGIKLWRNEYDGIEQWSYAKPFKMPTDTKKITSLCKSGIWDDLESINR